MLRVCYSVQYVFDLSADVQSARVNRSWGTGVTHCWSNAATKRGAVWSCDRKTLKEFWQC